MFEYTETTKTVPVVEPWVDSKTVAIHLGFKHDHIRKLARAGKIPGRALQNGTRVYWRFKISEVDRVVEASGGVSSIADTEEA